MARKPTLIVIRQYLKPTEKEIVIDTLIRVHERVMQRELQNGASKKAN